MAAQVTCSLFKIFRVARYKRINLEVNLINLSTLLTRDTCVSISRFSTINRIYPTILKVRKNFQSLRYMTSLVLHFYRFQLLFCVLFGFPLRFPARSGSFSYSCYFSQLRFPGFPDAHLKLCYFKEFLTL